MILKAGQINQIFVDALANKVKEHSEIEKKPLEVDFKEDFFPRHIRVYLYTVTHPPGGRDGNDVEHKVQIILPNQKRGENSKGNFDYSDDRFVLFGGYEPVHNVFIFWDADCYTDISYSRNVQVKGSTVVRAWAKDIAFQTRILRDNRKEIIVAGIPEKLPMLIQGRLKLFGTSQEDEEIKNIFGIH